jgi:hypothetical protein
MLGFLFENKNINYFFVADLGGFWRIQADFFKSAPIRQNPPKSATKNSSILHSEKSVWVFV